MAFGLGFVLLAWFFGGYSFLRWPWMPFRHLVQRWLLVVGSALLLAVLAGWLLNVPVTAVWFHRSTLLILGLALGLLGGVDAAAGCIRWQRRQAALASARSPVAQRMSRPVRAPSVGHGSAPTAAAVGGVSPVPSGGGATAGLPGKRPPEVGYAVVVNDHQPGEPVDQLAAAADLFLANPDNPGYGRAVNRLVVRLGPLPPLHRGAEHRSFLGAGSFEQMLAWLQQHPHGESGGAADSG